MSKISTYANLQSVTKGFESKAQVLNQDGYWLAGAKATQDQQVQDLLIRLDDIISKMPSNEKQELARKFEDIIPRKAAVWKEEYDKGFLDIVIEILGWGWLNTRYQNSLVKFGGTPDLKVLDSQGKLVAAMECKHFWMSREEEKYLESTMKSLENIKARKVDTRLVLNDPSENPFLWKLMCVLCKAEEQVNKDALRDNKFIFTNFSLDISSRLQIDDTKALLARLNSVLRRRGIEFIAFQDYDVNRSLT